MDTEIGRAARIVLKAWAEGGKYPISANDPLRAAISELSAVMAQLDRQSDATCCGGIVDCPDCAAHDCPCQSAR
jgi:hypothetical protein